MPVIGVGGGIASGKTTVCKFFEIWGAHIIDADLIGKDVVEKNPALLQELVRAFGHEILHDDGILDRRRLGQIVFQNQRAREKLNEIVHPALLSELTEKVKERLRENPEAVVVIDAALLLEWDLKSLLDALILVEASKEKRLERLVQSTGLTHKEARQRIQAQLHFKEKRNTADYILKNDLSLKELEAQTKVIWEKIVKIQNSKFEIPTFQSGKDIR